jgi:hypothetical protein
MVCGRTDKRLIQRTGPRKETWRRAQQLAWLNDLRQMGFGRYTGSGRERRKGRVVGGLALNGLRRM